jgi:hypothetical protein
MSSDAVATEVESLAKHRGLRSSGSIVLAEPLSLVVFDSPRAR